MNVVFDKSCVKSDILLDDRVDALKSASNVKYPVAYGNYAWNKECSKYPRILNPYEFLSLVRELEKNGLI